FVVLLYACYLSSRSGPVILLTTPSCTLFPYTTLFRSILTRNKMNYTVKQVVAILVSLTRSFIKAYTYIFKDLKATQKRLSSFNQDRKSTRLNSSHVKISYAVFCLKKKKYIKNIIIFNI